jgi:hypothetical protein
MLVCLLKINVEDGVVGLTEDKIDDGVGWLVEDDIWCWLKMRVLVEDDD